MRRVTLRGLRARKLRTALTAFAIVLGVAMVTGSSVLGATMKRSFDIVFSSAYEQTDVVVSGKPVVDWSESSAPTLPVSMLDQIRATPGVARAAGAIFDFSGNSPYAIVIAPNGKKISGEPSFVMGFKPEDEQFNPLRLREGRWAAGDGEVVLDASTADGHGVKVGDTVKIAALTPSAPFKVVGIGRFGKVSSLGGATMTVFDVPVAQRLLQKDGKLDVVSVAAADGVTAEALAQRLQPFASSTVQVQTADERAADDQAGIGLFVDIITWILRGFGGVVLFVGGFVIINTLSITVAQRTRELGTLRLIGATRSQVRRAVVLESLLIGILASLVGVAVGVALAVGLRALLGAFDFSFPADRARHLTADAGRRVPDRRHRDRDRGPPPRRPGDADLARGGGARGRHPAARQDGARSPPCSERSCSSAGSRLLALGMLKGGSLGVAGTLASSLGGMLLLFIGAAMLVPIAVPVIARIVGWPAARFAGIPGRLARDNAIRNPGRTASTAAALMIGIALVSAIAVLGRSLKVTAVEAVESQIGSSHVLQSETGWESLPPAAARTIASAPGVNALSSVRYDRGKIGKKQVDVSGIDPATIDGPYRFTWQEGSKQSLAALGTTGALVRDDLAEQKDLVVGDRISVLSAAGQDAELRRSRAYSHLRGSTRCSGTS